MSIIWYTIFFMTFEEESIEFLKEHIDVSFNRLMSSHLIADIEWLEFPDYRPVAYLEDGDGKDLNLICLFPPWHPSAEVN